MASAMKLMERMTGEYLVMKLLLGLKFTCVRGAGADCLFRMFVLMKLLLQRELLAELAWRLFLKRWWL